MKTAVILMMLTALYLLYRIAFPKRQEAKQGNETPQRDETDPLEVVGKSRFVMPDRSKPMQTPAGDANNETEEENALTFAAGNEKRDAVIPSGKLDEVFGETSNTVSELSAEPNPDGLDIEPDENETAADDEPDVDGEEEAEELRQTLGRDAQPAGGWSVEEMYRFQRCRCNGSVQGRTARTLYRYRLRICGDTCGMGTRMTQIGRMTADFYQRKSV